MNIGGWRSVLKTEQIYFLGNTFIGKFSRAPSLLESRLELYKNKKLKKKEKLQLSVASPVAVTSKKKIIQLSHSNKLPTVSFTIILHKSWTTRYSQDIRKVRIKGNLKFCSFDERWPFISMRQQRSQYETASISITMWKDTNLPTKRPRFKWRNILSYLDRGDVSLRFM